MLIHLLKRGNHRGFQGEPAVLAPDLSHCEESRHEILSSVELADEHGVCRGPPPCFKRKRVK